MERRIQGIREAAAYDPDKLVAPKELWTLHRDKDLEEWYEERRRIRVN